jgi:hypothetical protein
MNVTIIHENDDWLPPLRRALDDAGVPYDEWFVSDGHFDVLSEPPEGVFFNRMSASSHTRGHTASVPHTRQLLAWLERHGRRVVNGLSAFELEMSKVRQYQALQAAGVRVPATTAVAGGPDALVAAAQEVPTPFVTKHNRGGKGLGVELFESREAFEAHVRSDAFTPSPDRITLLQQYVEPADQTITRCEFVNGRFVYAVRADTSDGFELCPAEACRTDAPAESNASGDGASEGASEGERCMIDGDDSLFTLREDVPDALIARYVQFLTTEQIDVAGIEFIEDAEGRRWTYDVNGTTNYNAEIEAQADRSAWTAVATFLRHELEALASTV